MIMDGVPGRFPSFLPKSCLSARQTDTCRQPRDFIDSSWQTDAGLRLTGIWGLSVWRCLDLISHDTSLHVSNLPLTRRLQQVKKCWTVQYFAVHVRSQARLTKSFDTGCNSLSLWQSACLSALTFVASEVGIWRGGIIELADHHDPM